MKISKEFKFDAAHMLSDYSGKCANLHGHTYTGTVIVEGHVDEFTGMLIDYNDLKKHIDIFDHAIIFSSEEYRKEAEETLFAWAQQYHMNFIELSCKCTAENISKWIAEDIWSTYSNVRQVTVQLHETLGSSAVAIVGE